MMTARSACAMAGLIAVAGCVQPGPPRPTIAAMPGQGKDYATFQRDDSFCQQNAYNAVGGVSPGAAATQNGVASAAVGTGIGAAAGALLGAATGHAGAGAAIGAGAGLLVGSSAGANNAAYTGNSIQGHYNMVYAQCMTGQGEQVQGQYRPRYYGGPGRFYGDGSYAVPHPYNGAYDEPQPPPPPPPGY